MTLFRTFAYEYSKAKNKISYVPQEQHSLFWGHFYMVTVPDWSLKTTDEFKAEMKLVRFSFLNKIY